MANMYETNIEQDASGKKLHISRSFNAAVEKVWRAFTEKELLDQWWAPRPYRAETKSMQFVAGGKWLYVMISPQGERHCCRVDISEVQPGQSFRATAGFCDEEGNKVDTAPPMHWFARFEPAGSGSKLLLEISFDSEADLQAIVAMGFKEGFSMGLGNLDELLAAGL